MNTETCLYEGKAKRIYETDDPGVYRVAYKDDATAFNGEKKDVLTGKGRLNNEISSLVFSKLHEAGVANHFVRRLSETEQLVRKVSIIPIEVVVRNVAAGSLVKRLGLERGSVFQEPITEFYYKDDDLGDPLINDDHIRHLGLATPQELAEIRGNALEVNRVLTAMFREAGIRLVDFKLEFGRDEQGSVLLADEVSPDTCRLWDEETGESFDKDLFRFQLGDLNEGYETILTRLGGMSR
ncbi:phosphoribosylaminoimidazolesuccinocarboxamide synthase [Alteribacter natronophilus]|uniref:phosphoribosylaminoimidazolesuccinocarboxamide synthase n=1 Tax=Alteribacter natronophilus TaxID=2583810 RepID=UPI00110F0A1C|nr:phosphoribosylaminoimidazolesuccinocarboxamide synthase [Alteribacter natronophilus]TMW71100.1 phosphoribosylaminoimidazolesuccinocarboxamide synthase [Alteribacter natronophilus]